MWFYNGIPYMCEPEDIIRRLRDYALLNDRDILREIKVTTNAIMFTCPWHKNGRERKPSCGLIIRQKDKDSMPIGTVHCFSCGTVATLEEFISNCLGVYDGGKYGAKWLASNFLSIDLGSRPKLDLSNTLSRSSNNTYIPQIEYVSEEELDRYRYIHPYMYHRKLTNDIIEKFDVGYQKDFILDPKNPKCYPIECITFPVKDINGNTLFVARRAIQTKLFHYPDSAIKPIYGLYELQKYAPKDLKEIWICESILNCLSAWRSGHYAVALNGTGSYSQIQDLKKLNYRKFVLALDPDEAGINGCRKIYEALKNEKLITRVLIPKNHDLNDLTDEEINNLQEFYMNEKLTI